MTTLNFHHLLIDRRGAVSVITINRPQQMNALNADLLGEIQSAIRTENKHHEVRALILTGAGEKAFVAGADIAAMSRMSPAEAQQFSTLGHQTMDAVEASRVPVIAAVNGFCLGGGLELALACDFLYAAESARLGLPEVSLGLFPGWGGTQRLTRLLGKNRAKEVILSGRVFSAAECFAMGMVNRIFPLATLLEETLKTAQQIAARGPVAVAIAKELINAACHTSLKDGLALERSRFADCFTTKDLQEGLAAFVEKRPPTFQGK